MLEGGAGDATHMRYCPEVPQVVKDEAGNDVTEWTFQVACI